MKLLPFFRFCIVVLPLAGCSTAEFYFQGISGQLDLLARAKPIPSLQKNCGSF